MIHLRYTICDMRVVVCILGVAFAPNLLHAAPKKLSPVIAINAGGNLVYDADAQGNRVPDFSSAGYAGNDRQIPYAPVRVVVSPVQGDETARIQKAIDYVTGLPAGPDGVRGAILLQSGRHEIFGQLFITNSGIVLRGEGAGTNGTILVAAGTDRRTLIRITGQGDFTAARKIQIADEYVPVSAMSFHVQDASGLKPGDTIFITRPSTKEWIDTLGMDFGGGLNDWRLVWHSGNYDLIWDRTVQKVEGNLVTIDAPVTTALETRFGGGYVQTYAWPGRIENTGVENLRLGSAFDPQNPKDENHSWFAITMENCADSWVRQVTFEHFAGSAVAVYESCAKISVEDCRSLAPVSENGGWRRNTFFTMGQEVLFLRCRTENGRHDFSVGHCAAGPNAFVDCEADLPSADSGAIESWSSGTLYDNVRIDGNALSLVNRGGDGEGAGWSAANSVLWNCVSAKTSCENPPGAQNWAFGSWGEFEGNGIWRNSNQSEKPDSLFVSQLADRLGKNGAKQVLSPAKISAEAQNAKSVDEIPDSNPVVGSSKLQISITNGWLVCDGKLLLGGIQEVNWWRGNLLPNDVKNYGVNLSRFAPGRIGAGLTDDLGAVADGMVSDNLTALDHHYGLWYDRRREDHERVRRMTGDVWPPFYEQPFARSGVGTAWDGLSKYDLTKFNLWYWARLKNFADICDERGLVLFNENYFQHNILEDGAHWVDSPWRSQNNINDTGFNEPPFEMDKRIVMADQFYDVTQPVRRELHKNFIRQNLDNYTKEANVIQFTSAEFTGPTEFMQFWLDTVGDWENEKHLHPLIALAAPKNVQDAILADAKRTAVVDIIAFRYWWQTDDGMFAPDGGNSLSPRQFQRQWKGGPPSDENLAAMTAEYRAKFPGKVVLAASEQGFNFGHAAWAYLCAGGSMPILPRTTDTKLLAAIPQMKSWVADTDKELWALRDAGRQILIYGKKGVELDLSDEPGAFRLNKIDSNTGEVKIGDQVVQGGGKITLPGGVIWLTKE
ncbi:MAG TPA: DUF6298 domain-containing protein [Candidatus Sulfotelmatobacter sp.]|jgi:hypothetical protein|nr:DUF6298 domain-containing protein [Candidatus Sulfotelmatobacter sp.]